MQEMEKKDRGWEVRREGQKERERGQVGEDKGEMEDIVPNVRHKSASIVPDLSS